MVKYIAVHCSYRILLFCVLIGDKVVVVKSPLCNVQCGVVTQVPVTLLFAGTLS